MSPFYQYQHYCTALPSPPLSYLPKLPYLINPSRSLSSQATHGINNNNLPHLPSIHHVVLTPSSPDNNSATPDSTPSSPSSSSTYSHTYKSPSSPQQRRKSILSLLNSDPELKRLDEEEYKCGYQSHFMNDGVKRKHFHSHRSGTSKRLKSSNGKNDKQRDTLSSCAPTAATSLLRLSSLSNKGGLRHFSKQVCDKVEIHGITTYDQIVHEITRDFSTLFPSACFDQKNIRRRVYDSLNVLRAMNIIAKVKKEIKWLGIPSCCQLDEPNNENMGPLLLDADDSLLAQQIHAEEVRKKTLSSSLSDARLDLRNSLIRYLQLRRLIYRNQHESGHDPLTALPFMLTVDDMKYLQNSNSLDSPYQIIKDDDILQAQFNHPFTTQELIAWLPDSSWYHYLDLTAS
ncbi:unnamed protein product [Absidia cylindrospora]